MAKVAKQGWWWTDHAKRPGFRNRFGGWDAVGSWMRARLKDPGRRDRRVGRFNDGAREPGVGHIR